MEHSSFKVYNASAGSGKTFTLVKEYLKILLTAQSNYTFQNILAITFTNKAAAEMKERVLGTLRDFGEGGTGPLLEILSKETLLVPEFIQKKSKQVLQNILQNYSAFNITTIDSFTHKLIRTFAYDLGLPLNFEVEMDGQKLLGEAVDLLISKIGENKELTDLLIDFSFQKIEQDTSWDFTKILLEIAAILLKEEDAKNLENVGPKTIADFKKIKEKLITEKKAIEKEFCQLATEALQIIDAAGIEHKSFSYGDLPKYFLRFLNLSDLKTSSVKPSARLANNVDNDVFYSKSASKSIAASIDAIAVELKSYYDKLQYLLTENYGNYFLINAVLKNLIPIATLNYIKQELDGIKEQNSICLSAEFNTIISEKIKNEPAPFIYERIGEKFSHFFIDEMQDTSALQWENLIPLIANALAQEGASLMLVGDAKQAIYRWRGGKAEQFINLAADLKTTASNPFYVPKKVENLPVNYRSFSEVIGFNNQFFTHIAEVLQNPIYKDMYLIGNQQELNANIGGYVQVDFVEKSEEITDKKELFAQKTYEIIQGLDRSFKKSDVCIIVRTRAEGVVIANYLTEHGIAIISSETLLLQNSEKVQFLIYVLQYINNSLNLDAKFKILQFLSKNKNISEDALHQYYSENLELESELFFEKLASFKLEAFYNMPFFECVEYVIRSFDLNKTSDAYLQFFMDYVLDYQRKNHHDLGAFLEEWKSKKDKLSIAAAENDEAVQIMTIHKSKGLEFPVVIFPSDVVVDNERNGVVWYDDFDKEVFEDLSTFQIGLNKDFEMIGADAAAVYTERKSVVSLDNFNLLYVALTRAAEQMYLISNYKEDSKNESAISFSSLYVDFLSQFTENQPWDFNKRTYSFGEKKRLCFSQNEKPTSVEEQQDYISGAWESHQIEIVSNASKKWGDEKQKAVDYGLLIHEMFSKIISFKDVEKVVQQYLNVGLILASEKNNIQKSIENVVFNEKLEKYFSKDVSVLTEQEIVDAAKNVLIPDRLVFEGNEVTIIDFKTGKKEVKHEKQIKSYKNVLENMGFLVKKCYLVYLGNYIFVKDI